MHHHKRWQNKETDTAYDADVPWCKQGDTVTVSAEGADEDAAVASLKEFFETTYNSPEYSYLLYLQM